MLMTESYTGVRVHDIAPDLINQLYKEKTLLKWDQRLKWSENMYLVLKDITGTSQSALARVKGEKVDLIENGISASNIKPKNKEQRFALDALMDDKIRVVALTGRAGTGKTLLSLAAGMQKVQDGIYKRILLTRPMSEVGKNKLGALPGDVNEKFEPYLAGAISNLEYMMGGDKKKVHDLISQYKIEYIPLQLIRGASWHNSFIIADEIQTLGHHEMVTLGTRVAEGSKLVVMGDLAQRDEKISRENTGLYKFINSERAKQSEFVTCLELIKSERSCVAELFADIFEAY